MTEKLGIAIAIAIMFYGTIDIVQQVNRAPEKPLHTYAIGKACGATDR